MARFYFDEHMRHTVANGLRSEGHEVVMAIEVGMVEKDDDLEHLPYANEHNLVMVTFDRPFAGRTMARTDHHGLVCLAEDFRNDIGGQIRALLKFSKDHTSEGIIGNVFWLK